MDAKKFAALEAAVRFLLEEAHKSSTPKSDKAKKHLAALDADPPPDDGDDQGGDNPPLGGPGSKPTPPSP